jgi:hypothetical protein
MNIWLGKEDRMVDVYCCESGFLLLGLGLRKSLFLVVVVLDVLSAGWRVLFDGFGEFCAGEGDN